MKKAIVFNSNWNVDVSKDQIPELIGQIIDVFENFLDEKGIKKEMIPNTERDEYEEDRTAIIFGDDYDLLADSIMGILGISR